MTKKPTPLSAAIARPLPATLAAAVAKAKAATAAFHTARGAIDEFRQQQFTDNLPMIEAQLAEVTARIDVARHLGEVPANDDLEAMEKLRVDLANTVTRRSGRRALEAGLVKAIDDRRQAVVDAETALGLVLDGWRQSVLIAADDQIAEAVRMIAEAQGTAVALKPTAEFDFPVSVPCVTRAGRHEATRLHDLPAELLVALDTWTRAFRIGVRG